MMLMGLGLIQSGSGTQQPSGSGMSRQQAGSGLSSGRTMGVYQSPYPLMFAPGAAEAPPIFHVSDDCLVIMGHGSPHATPQDPAWMELVSRVQRGLNYIRATAGGTPIPITGQWDFLTQTAWMVFWSRYGKIVAAPTLINPGRLENQRIDTTLSCKGLRELVYAVSAQHMAALVTTPVDSGLAGGEAAVSTGDPSHVALHFFERDGLWIVVPDDRDWLKSVLRTRVYASETVSGSLVYARAARVSTSIPPGQDAWSKIVQRYNQGYAVLIGAHQVNVNADIRIMFTKAATSVWKHASTAGAGLSAAMHGFGQMPTLGGGGGGVQTQMTIGGSGGGAGGGGVSEAPDPATGLPGWALVFPGPKALLDAARAIATGQLPSGGGGGTITGGSEQTQTYPPGGLPGGAPGAPAPAPAASASTPWLLLGGVAVVGAAAYFLI
jgi:hypothetical protein